MKLFISHASDDSELAELVVQLLTSALGLRSQDIRCTSVDGYKLPGGAETDEQLREETLAADCFIGILSAQSLSSTYVLFELGARWGAKRHLLPLLGPGLTPQALRRPLSGLNALSCDNMSELHQLVHEMAEILGIEAEPPAVYQRHVEAVIYYGTTREVPIESDEQPSQPASATPASSTPTKVPADESYSEADAVIQQHCEREWPDDYAMRAYCIEQQKTAVGELKQGRPSDVPEEVFQQIRRKCAREWPDDYAMRQYCEEQQVTAYRKVRPPGR